MEVQAGLLCIPASGSLLLPWSGVELRDISKSLGVCGSGLYGAEARVLGL